MKKIYVLGVTALIVLASCGANKELVAAQEKLKNTEDLLNTATVKLNSCLSDKAVADANLTALKRSIIRFKKNKRCAH